MRQDDHAMSELVGYTVLVAVVSIAAIALLAGSMSSLSSAGRQAEALGTSGSLKSFAEMASRAVDTNNSYYAAFEMSVPSGCELIATDKHDDFRSLDVYSGSGLLAHLPLGSVAIRSPFASAAFEGGAVIRNDTGLVTVERSPSVYAISQGSGKKSLYVSIVAISSDSFVMRSGPAVLYVKCSAVKPMSWHVPDGTALTLKVRSGGLRAWEEQLERCGFSVRLEEWGANATSTEVSDIHVVYYEACVKPEGR